MIPNRFFGWGILGISILIYEFYHIDMVLPLILIYLPYVYLDYKRRGKNFAMHTFLFLIILGVLLHYLNIPPVTEDNFPVAVIDSLFIGLGIGFVIRGRGVIVGLEVIAADPKALMFIQNIREVNGAVISRKPNR